MTIRANIKDRNHEPWFNEDVKKLWDNKIYTSSQFGFYKNQISKLLYNLCILVVSPNLSLSMR